MHRKLLVVIFALTALAVVPSVAVAGGNSANAKLCQKNGWKGLSPSNNPSAGFASQDACVSYGAQGGTVVPTIKYPDAAKACTDAGYTYSEPGGYEYGDPQNAIHFICGFADGVQEAWNGPEAAIYPYCYFGTHSFSTIDTAWGGRWAGVCYGSLPADWVF